MRCRCSGIWGPYNVEIVDTVLVPDVPPGDYVVGFRYDCVRSLPQRAALLISYIRLRSQGQFVTSVKGYPI